MEEINIKELLDFYVSKISIIILTVFIAVLIGALYALVFQEPVYEAQTTLVLTGTTDSAGTDKTDSAITQNDINLNSKLVATYRNIINSRTILKEVIATLNLDYTTEQLQRMITVSSVTDTEIISIAVRSSDAEEAASLANELARVFSLKIVDVFNIDNISVIDRAEVDSEPVNINILKQLIIYFLIGFAIGAVIIFVMFCFDTTLKDVSQIEKLGLNVLCTIPLKLEERQGKK